MHSIGKFSNLWQLLNCDQISKVSNRLTSVGLTHPQILADQLHNPISTKESRLLCPQNNTGTFGFSDLPTVLQIMYIWCPSQGRRVSIFGEISTMTLEPPSKLESFLSTHAVTFPHRCTHLFCRLLILGMRVRLTWLKQARAHLNSWVWASVTRYDHIWQ